MAHSAPVRLLASMHKEMSLKMFTSTKLLVAQFTLVVLLTCMGKEMSLKISTSTKLLLTQYTLMGLVCE